MSEMIGKGGMVTETHELILLSELMEMRGSYGPMPEDLVDPKMQEFDEALVDQQFKVAVPKDEVFAALCGDKRLNQFGLRYNHGYFAFGGSFMPVLGEALADPEAILQQRLRMDTHAHQRARQLYQINPRRRFVFHTDDQAEEHPDEDSIGCGLVKGRRVVLERIASGEFKRFVTAGNRVGHTNLDPESASALQLQRNAGILLDSNYLSVSNAALQRVPDDLKDVIVKEILFGKHNEKRWAIETNPYWRTQTSEIWPKFGNWGAFVSSPWGQAIEAYEWARMNTGGLDKAETQSVADIHNNAMGLITVAGIATLGNEDLSAVTPRASQ